MGRVTQLLARVEARVGAVAAQWPLHRAMSAMSARRWQDAWERLAEARRLATRAPVADVTFQRSIDELWLVCALQLGREDTARFEETVATIGALDVEVRPESARDLGALRRLGQHLIDDGEPWAAAVLGRALAWLAPPSPSRDYLAARLVEHGARAAAAARPFDGRAVLAWLGEAEALYRQVETTAGERRAATARVRRAGLVALLGGAESLVAQRDARTALGRLNPWLLPERERLAYAAVQLESPRRMRRVRALDVLERLARTEHRTAAARLLESRLMRLGAVRDGLERDRLDGAIGEVLDAESAVRARAWLSGVETGRAPEALDDIEDPSRRRYQAAVRALGDGGRVAPVVPPSVESPFDAGRLALQVSCEPTTEGIERLWRYYRRGGRDEDLVPLARLLPVCLSRWESLSASHEAVRELVALYVARAPAPPYGFGAVAELCVAAGEPVLAARASERALREGLTEVAAQVRATQLVVDGVAVLVGRGELEEARALMQALASVARR